MDFLLCVPGGQHDDVDEVRKKREREKKKLWQTIQDIVGWWGIRW